MGHFVVTVDPVTGLKDIAQVPTDEDAIPESASMPDGFDDELDAELAADLKRDLEADTPPDLTIEDGGDEDPPADEAANECMAGLYSENVSWAKKLIAKIQTQAGIKAVRDMEIVHPEYTEQGGRKGVLNALQERSGEILQGQTQSDGLERGPKDPPPPATRGTGLPCGECDFTGGSEAALASHMETAHPEVAL